MEGRRIFAAIDISDEAKARVAEYVKHLRRDFGHLRVGWERAEKLHITIRFAGYLDERQLEIFTAKAATAAGSTAPFDITINGTGSFIKRKGSNVLWLGLEAEPLALVAGLFDDTVQNENERPRRSFNPHLTIARLREPQNSRDLVARHMAAAFGPVAFRASELVVYESKLLPTGSEYSAVSKHRFTGQAII